MSKRAFSNDRTDGAATLEAGLEAFQSSPEFHGPVEDVDGHHCNDHFAHIYETPEEKFTAAVPFVRHGLDRGEHVLYVIDESTEREVKAALREGGIDVDAAVDSGVLSFPTVQETYLRNGTFDVDEMIGFYADTVEEVTEEYAALRIVAEMTWIPESDTPIERFMEYEQKINELFAETESLAICQYNRDRFPPEAIRDVVRCHPHLVYDGAACHNLYYTPPEEFFGEGAISRENDRMLRTLRDRAAAKAEMQARERFLRECYEITADPVREFEAKLDALFELGRERFDMEVGGMAKVDSDTDFFEVEAVSGDHDHLVPGARADLSETYCRLVTNDGYTDAVTDPVAAGFEDCCCYREFGVQAYLGTHFELDGGSDRTLWFVSTEPRDDPINDAERSFVHLMGQWVKYELGRQQREEFLRECYQITADPARRFEEKLHELLDLARGWTDLDAAGLTHLPEWEGRFLTEYAIGYGADDGVVTAADGVWTDPGEGSYCRGVMESDAPIGKADVRGTSWEDDWVHRQQGLSCYLGTKITSGSTPYGTLWVGSADPRDREFTETERTFLELIGQWVSYEVERREHNESQRELYEITADTDLPTDEKIDRLLEAGCDRLGLPVGMLTHEREEAFEIEYMHGAHPDLDEGTLTPPLTDNYCRRVVETGESISVADAEAAGWDGDALYHTFDLRCYAGTQVTVDGDTYGTVCFADTAPREEFTETERAFVDLLGQCVGYEFERQQHERERKETIGRLQQSNERLERFAYAASHDLQEPLRMVTSYLRLLEHRYADAFDEDGEEFLAFAVDGADRMREMIDGLLKYSRVETGGDPLEPVELDAVVDDALKNLQIGIEETDAEIEVEALPRVEGDAGQLRQVFQNLLDNALTYSGGESPRIRVDAERRGREWVISVRDDGIGIDPDDHETIFTVFDRLHSREEYDGTGIGLALCERIVERHDGEIWVESVPGEGATFSFTLSATGE